MVDKGEGETKREGGTNFCPLLNKEESGSLVKGHLTVPLHLAVKIWKLLFLEHTVKSKLKNSRSEMRGSKEIGSSG